jgi:formylglycine-generating enzyme required for sulfatase activity
MVRGSILSRVAGTWAFCLILSASILYGCATMKDLPVADPDWIYGEGEGIGRNEAEQAARDDLLGRALQESGGGFVREELWSVQGSSSDSVVSYAVKLRQNRIGELPQLHPVSNKKLKAGGWRTVYRISRKQWLEIEALHKKNTIDHMTLEWANVLDEKFGIVERIQSLASIVAQLEAEGWVDAELPLQNVISLKAESEKQMTMLANQLKLSFPSVVRLAIEGESISIQASDQTGSVLGYAGIPLAVTIALKPGITGRVVKAVTDENGKASIPVQAQDKEAGRLWYCEVRTDFSSAGSGTLPKKLDNQTAMSSTWRHLSSRSILFPREVKVARGFYPIGRVMDDIDAEPDEAAMHQVEVDGFLVQENAVTMEAWRVFQDINPGPESENLWIDNESFNGPQQPVIGVTWAQVAAYASWLSRLQPGYRLPTETEWEVFGRAGSDGKYPWGNQAPGPTLAKYRNTGSTSTADVRSFAHGKNAFGLWDIAGNVWEWTNSETEHILGGKTGWKAVKGGAWTSTPAELRLSNHRAMDPGVGRSDVGFRLVRELQQ